MSDEDLALSVVEDEPTVKWIRDGHTARVVLDRDMFMVRLQCPNDGDHASVEWEALPPCRKNYDEAGQPDPAESPLTFCNFAEWAESDGWAIEAVDVDLTSYHEWTVTGGDFPIGWRWTGDCYVWAPSALLDASGVSS